MAHGREKMFLATSRLAMPGKSLMLIGMNKLAQGSAQAWVNRSLLIGRAANWEAQNTGGASVLAENFSLRGDPFLR